MSKKDYDLLASAINEAIKSGNYADNQARVAKHLVSHIAAKLKADNAGFKIDKFMTACSF